jgi:hypothetical protein
MLDSFLPYFGFRAIPLSVGGFYITIISGLVAARV